MHSAKPASSLLDPLPPKLYVELFSILGPTILNLLNLSIKSGVLPSAFKTAVISPPLKRPNLDPESLNNYRPISNLPFLSKILEKIVAAQLIAYMSSNSLFEVFQSGFRRFHSTETALTKVTNDVLLAMDAGDTSMLILLDLSAAFDTVDHTILLKRLENQIGIRGLALSWLKSYLSERKQCVHYNNVTSEYRELNCGVS